MTVLRFIQWEGANAFVATKKKEDYDITNIGIEERGEWTT